jgi:hypothetical protein
MSARQQLHDYLNRLEKRLRTGTAVRGAAVVTSVALIATVVLVLIANAFAFSGGSIISARIVLVLALAAAAALGIAWPLYGLNVRRTARKAEDVFPQFDQRLLTFAERDGDPKDPFMELLAADTMQVARAAEPARLVTDARLFAALTAGVASLAVLVWIIAAGPGFLGAGASLLWTGTRDAETPFYDLKVMPGDAAIRRNTDQVITAQLVGLQTQQVRLFARSRGASAWEQVKMEPQSGGTGFQFLFSALPDDLEYYVEAGALRSKHYNIRVVDLPAVKQIKVTYRFPAWTGLPPATEDPGGDLRAVQGTAADLEITMDRPLRDGILVLDDNKQVTLAPGSQGSVYKATVQMDKDGLYHVAALDQGQQVRLSGDYFIEARQAMAPEISIGRPGRDYRSNPVEEITVTVAADAEFGLTDMSLHYSVNGAPEKVVPLLKQKGAREADGSTTLYLEDYKMVPGDVVSFYATAKDARAESQTDIFFIQADPFEREFSQSQAGGGGGGGGGGGMQQQEEISKREKDIIAATWSQQRDKNPNKQQALEAAQFLSDMQGKLRDQAESLAGRLQRRELTEQNQEFSDFQKSMESAAQAMGPAADSLKQLKWADALPHEQQALQQLLRAEATFRQISVAFGQQGGGGGGGGGGGAGRDLSSLFDLELDTEKNQYETEQSANSAKKQDEQIDEALQKLEQLARRQQELASQRNNGVQTPDQRWQQEMLRREAEQLQQQLEQMSRNGQQGQQGQQQSSQQGGQQGGQQSGQQSGQQGGQGSQQGGQQGGSQSASGSQNSNSRVQEALNRVRQANDDMRRATSQGQSEADARRAAERLKEATDLLGGEKQQQASGQLDSLAREADRLAAEQRAQANRMADMFGQPGTDTAPGRPRAQAGAPSAQEQRQFAQDRQQTARDLARLQDQMRQSMRSLASSQRDASTKLREALAGIEDSDLQNMLERSANWVGQGAGPFAGTIEPRISEGFGRLNDQVRQAQAALGNQQGQGQGREQALDRVQRLRENLEAIDRNMANRNGQRGQGQPGQQGQGQQGQQGQGQQAGQGQQGQQGQQGGQGQGGQQAGGQQGGGNGNQQAGAYGGIGNRVGGGNWNGGVNGGWWGGRDYYGAMNPGGQVFPNEPNRQVQPLSQAEMERMYRDAQQQLNDLRQAYRDEPATLGDIQGLIRQMQAIDPSRFPGNPALVEQLHTQVLAGIDRLELQVRRQVEDQQGGGQIRSGDSSPVPSGYGDAWAEYTRRLSKEK